MVLQEYFRVKESEAHFKNYIALKFTPILHYAWATPWLSASMELTASQWINLTTTILGRPLASITGYTGDTNNSSTRKWRSTLQDGFGIKNADGEAVADAEASLEEAARR